MDIRFPGNTNLNTTPKPAVVQELQNHLARTLGTVAYNNRGFTYLNLGEYQRAIEDLNEALRLDPQDALACNNRCAERPW